MKRTLTVLAAIVAALAFTAPAANAYTGLADVLDINGELCDGDPWGVVCENTVSNDITSYQFGSFTHYCTQSLDLEAGPGGLGYADQQTFFGCDFRACGSSGSHVGDGHDWPAQFAIINDEPIVWLDMCLEYAGGAEIPCALILAVEHVDPGEIELVASNEFCQGLPVTVNATWQTIGTIGDFVVPES